MEKKEGNKKDKMRRKKKRGKRRVKRKEGRGRGQYFEAGEREEETKGICKES